MKKILQFSPVSVLCLLVALFLGVQFAGAQQTLGSMNGTVTDISGAAIPGASVTAVSEQTGLTRSTRSHSNGYWEILNLPIGPYHVTITAANFETLDFPHITVREGLATTIPKIALKPGQVTQSITVNANPLLNATDTTNGYTLDKAQIAETPLATGSFTQLAILAPGVSSQLLSGVGTDSGLGNQPIWSNGQRDTSNTITVNGVDVGNLFNGKTSSQDVSQRYQFNIGEGSNTGGQDQDNISVYGSNGNGLASPPPEFMQEINVTTSMYDAQQGQTSGAHVTISTSTGTNSLHGQAYGVLGSNLMNADPFFYKQDVALGTLPASEANPQLHRWVGGGTLGGPVKRNRLFFFLGYQHLYDSDQTGALSQFQVPYGLSDDRSTAGIQAACTSYITASGYGSCPSSTKWSPAAVALLSAKLPNGSYLIPSADASGQTQLQNGQPDVTLQGTSVFRGDWATGSLDFNATDNDHLSAKYFYQHTPTNSPFAASDTIGFPESEDTGAQTGSLTNSITVGPRINWVQQIGFSRQKVYSSLSNALTASDVSISAPANIMPGIEAEEFGIDTTSPFSTAKIGPLNADGFIDQGYFQNRLSPSSTAIFSFGKHTISVGFNYDYNQLNIRNNAENHSYVETSSFTKFLSGSLHGGNVLQGNSNRYYRSNDAGAFVSDKWQVLPNVSITAGVRYDFDGPFSEKNGDLFNFDPSLYSATDSAVTSTGFIVAGNNKQFGTAGVSDSTLKGRQWGIAPRLGVAWSPKQFGGNVVWRAGAGIYYDRGEYFQYLSPPAGSGISGPFGVTQEAPFAAYTSANGTLSQPFTSFVSPTTPSNLASIMPTVDSIENTCTAGNVYSGYNSAGQSILIPYSCNDGAPDGPLVIGNYGINNVLPYTENWMTDIQWQPRSDTSIDIGYVGNRGKHEVIPIPFNEPGIATPTHTINRQMYSYGVQVLSNDTDASGNPYAMANEPYDSYSGGNVDLRVPYVGYDPNSASFETVGISSYDALQAQLTKRMSHDLQLSASYTWSHTLDEQSDVGLFFTGDNPDDLRESYADADFDQTNTLTFNYMLTVPNLVKDRSNWLSKVTNDWSLLGVTVLQSGEPYSIYDYTGSVGSEYFGGNIELTNPVLPIEPGLSPKSVKTGNSGAYTYAMPNGSGGATPVYYPALKASDFYIPLVAPGTNGVPPCDRTTAGGNAGPGGGPLCDVYETTFVGGQRNIFRQSFQKRADITLQKDIHATERYDLRYQFEVFNVTNTPSFDVPTNALYLSPNYEELANPPGGYADGTQAQPYASTDVTTPKAPNGGATCQGSSVNCAYEMYLLPQNGNAELGVVKNTIGSQRLVEMSLHLMF
ncbi:MAG TPA: carboxypeptidase regulatory-like domain-containing protein [Acidobacteriaceae bacterium]|nr:carboxypeptidase regulatory-like domain-containing protein [Acidobacteriaceae bacterium]